MKKTKLLAAIALSLALGGTSAYAAEPGVTVYGVVDTGLQYTHVFNQSTNTAEMNTGNYAGSRWGLKGSEKIGASTVGFILESGFNSDDGTEGQDGRLFGRESQIYVSGDYGTVGLGRVGAFTSGVSSLSRFWDFDPFETGYTDAGTQGTQVNSWSLYSNTLYYVSPKFSGFEAGAMYSLAGDHNETTGMAKDDHFGNAFLRWDGKNVRAITGLELYHVGHEYNGTTPNKDRWSFKLAGAWTPNGGPVTLYAGYSFYKNQAKFADSTWDDDSKVVFDKSGKGLEAHAVYLGGKYELGNAALMGMFQFLTGKNKGAEAGAEDSYKRYVASVGCHYYFSKRTMGYAVASYAKGSGILNNDNMATNRVITTVGLTHWF